MTHAYDNTFIVWPRPSWDVLPHIKINPLWCAPSLSPPSTTPTHLPTCTSASSGRLMSPHLLTLLLACHNCLLLLSSSTISPVYSITMVYREIIEHGLADSLLDLEQFVMDYYNPTSSITSPNTHPSAPLTHPRYSHQPLINQQWVHTYPHNIQLGVDTYGGHSRTMSCT